jgi:Zn-dependent peptidase ImmA (M78 family)
MEQYSIDLFVNVDEHIQTTVSNLRKLGEYLKLPVSTFFMDEAPPFPVLPKDHRKAVTKFSKNTINAIRQGYWYQDLIKEHMYEFSNKFEVRFSTKENPTYAGQQISSLIEFEKLRTSASDADILLRNLRYTLEDYNIYIFKYDFPTDETRGFSMSGDPTVIVISKSARSAGRIFTVFHELAHILLNKPGISEPVGIKEEDQNKIETWCDKFAAAIVIPEDYIKDIDLVDEEDIGPAINDIATELSVSKHSIAFTLLRNNKIEYNQYYEFINRPFRRISDEERKPIPQRHIIISNKGKKFTNMILEVYSDSGISDYEACSILDTNPKTLMELLAA